MAADRIVPVEKLLLWSSGVLRMAIKTVLAIIAIVAAAGLLAAVAVPGTVSAQIYCQPGYKPLETPHGAHCISDKGKGPSTVPP
jgi:hypothetical protein